MNVWISSLGFLLLSGCVAVRSADTVGAQPSVDTLLGPGQRILWVAAHPDDEAIVAGALLARACLGSRNTCHFLVLTQGDGGECDLASGCGSSLGAIRHRELSDAARRYGASLEHYAFSNAPLPVESFPPRAEIERKWIAAGNPTELIAAAVTRFEPTVVMTFDPEHGFTGHPEHQAAARFALAGIRKASPAKAPVVLQVINRYWFMGLGDAGQDPELWTDTFRIDQDCDAEDGRYRTCADILVDNSYAHRSQESDMSMIRFASHLVVDAMLRRVDPMSPEVERLLIEMNP